MLLLVAVLLLLLVFEGTPLDLELARLFYDPQQAQFPLRRTWLFEQFLHKDMRHATRWAVYAALGVCCLGYLGKLSWLPRRNALFAALGMLLIPAVVSLLKARTQRYCPWDIVEFGGFAPYQSLLAAAPTGLKAGRCFPAGHASAGFLWLVWAFALRPAGRRATRLGLAAGLCMGSLFGLERMIQGAHFLSHTLWSLWFAWATSLALALLLKAELDDPAGQG
ncbi:MAG: phosphatase PAP2 family protein [Azoarcus sp.]|nr:phosphatase PAP2 family protein [Azoarcus sp.]